MMAIADLWDSSDPHAWDDALKRYWAFVQERNRPLEERLEALDLERLRRMNAEGWYDFLKHEYFHWKYTAPNRYATTTRLLRRYVETDTLGELDLIRQRLLSLDAVDVPDALEAACAIRGLGTSGASGLLALMYPQSFGTVDQFVVKALREVRHLPKGPALARMNAERLSLSDGMIIIRILRRKAADNNKLFGDAAAWTPRKIDKVLWTYGR